MALKQTKNKKTGRPRGLAATCFYNIEKTKLQQNDRMAMKHCLIMTKEVMDAYVESMDETLDEIKIARENITASRIVQEKPVACMEAIMAAYVKFYEEWLSEFLQTFQDDLELKSGVACDDIDEKRNWDVEDRFLVKLRKTLVPKKVKIPRALHDLPINYAYINFGIAFFSHDREYFNLERSLWSPEERGTNHCWTADTDQGQLKFLLTSKEPYYALRAFKSKNYIMHCVPSTHGGRNVSAINKQYLDELKQWKETWYGERDKWKEQFGRNENVIIRYPKKTKYTESKFKLTPESRYMKCPGCDYIVLLSDSKTIGETKNKGSRKGIWIPGKNGSKKIDLENIEFYSDYKYKWPYKSMQAHVTNCLLAQERGVPSCFGKKRKRKNPPTDVPDSSSEEEQPQEHQEPPEEDRLQPPTQQIQEV